MKAPPQRTTTAAAAIAEDSRQQHNNVNNTLTVRFNFFHLLKCFYQASSHIPRLKTFEIKLTAHVTNLILRNQSTPKVPLDLALKEVCAQVGPTKSTGDETKRNESETELLDQHVTIEKDENEDRQKAH